jgi:ABC-2 type transport system ATP-binding protein
LIEVKNLVKFYGSHLALDHVSFQLEDCSAVALLGPNGAGKSTTMNIMTSNLGASAGQVLINGFDLGTQPAGVKRSVGYLPEIPPLYPELTVEEYLHYVCGLKGIPRSERKKESARVMERIQIDDMKNRLIRYLSKGYRQRVGIAQALVGNPEIVILDEPSIGLDPRQAIEVREIVRSLKGRHTILFSTHILSEAEAVCDRAVILHKGRVVANETIRSLKAKGKDLESVFLDLTGGRIPSFEGGEAI